MKDEFRVSFVPSRSAEEVYVKLRIGADDDDKRNAEIRSAFKGSDELSRYKGFIVLDHIEKDKKVILTVKLANARRCLLEVVAYVK